MPYWIKPIIFFLHREARLNLALDQRSKFEFLFIISNYKGYCQGTPGIDEHILCYKIRVAIKFSRHYASYCDNTLTYCKFSNLTKSIKGTVMQMEKALINDRLRVSKVF